MNVQAALKGQYRAALAMLKQAIEKCPEPLWTDDRQYPVAFWRVAFHTLFFTHFYLQPHVDAFCPWEKQRGEAHCFGPPPWVPDRPPIIAEPYTKAELLDYWRFCEALVNEQIDRLDLASPESGFPWYKIPKLDHQLVNIRHIQHHAALLAGRLRLSGAENVGWVGSG